MIRGPADDVSKARHMLNELVTELAETSHMETISIPAMMHRHIIGRNGASIKKVKDGMAIPQDLFQSSLQGSRMLNKSERQECAMCSYPDY